MSISLPIRVVSSSAYEDQRRSVELADADLELAALLPLVGQGLGDAVDLVDADARCLLRRRVERLGGDGDGRGAVLGDGLGCSGVGGRRSQSATVFVAASAVPPLSSDPHALATRPRASTTAASAVPRCRWVLFTGDSISFGVGGIRGLIGWPQVARSEHLGEEARGAFLGGRVEHLGGRFRTRR